MKYIIVLLFSIGATAQDFNFECGPTNYDFRYYYDQFEEDAADFNISFDSRVSIDFGVLPDDVGGRANWSYLILGENCFVTNRNISINRNYWDDSNESIRKILIYHELAHAILFLDHSNTNTDIMYWQANTVMTIDEERLRRLFTGEGQVFLDPCPVSPSGKGSVVTINN